MTDTLPRILVILKPETLEKFLIGEILSRFDKAKLVPLAMKQMTASRDQMMFQYSDCYKKYGREIADQIVKRMTRGPCIFILYTILASEKESYGSPQDFIDFVRTSLIGATDPDKAAKGTIRGDLAKDIRYNLIHASDSVNSSAHEIDLWFPEIV